MSKKMNIKEELQILFIYIIFACLIAGAFTLFYAIFIDPFVAYTQTGLIFLGSITGAIIVDIINSIRRRYE